MVKSTNSTLLSCKHAQTGKLKVANKIYTISQIQTSPCKANCPINTDVKAYISLISLTRFNHASNIIKKDNPIPATCGRVCPHPCQKYCTRTNIDQSLAICSLKRFVTQITQMNIETQMNTDAHSHQIAIIGSGPAGLTAASDLARLGYKITIFEKLPASGGMLYAGIPQFRLPKDVIKNEIIAIKKMGVKIKTNTEVKNPIALKKQGYKAIFIATGAHIGLKLNIPGEQKYKGILDSIAFFRGINFGKTTNIGKKVVVIGGSNSAIDSARTAKRLGADVNLVYRRTIKEMPALYSEIEQAEKEGVKFHFLISPLEIIGNNGKISALKCIKNKLGKQDASGRRSPVPIKNSEFQIKTDTIISAIGQEPDTAWLPQNHNFKLSKWNSFSVNEQTLETNIDSIFAGGDCVTGPQTVIGAIKAGHIAANSIHRYIKNKPLIEKDELPERCEYEILLKTNSQMIGFSPPQLPIKQRKGFKEVELCFSEKIAIKEAKRCLKCGPCAECYDCSPQCDKKLIALSSDKEQETGDKSFPSFLRVSSDFQTPAKASLLLNSTTSTVNLLPLTARIIPELCRTCGECEKVCPYNAINSTNSIYLINSNCKGCGACIPICQSSAITMDYFNDSYFNTLLKKAISKNKIIAFLCYWAYPINQEIECLNSTSLIRVLCSSRISPAIILKAFALGAHAVIGIACPEQNCHYIKANEAAHLNYEKAKNLLSIVGIASHRIGYEHLNNPHQLKEIVNTFETLYFKSSNI